MSLPVYKELKIAFIHCLLLADMCLFMSAIVNAHLTFTQSLDSKCGEQIDSSSIKPWATVGYSLRIIFTAFFFVTKFISIYKFIKNPKKFPKIGAFYSPIMTTLLLSVIIYDFQECKQLSGIFSITSARNLLSSYSIIIIIVFSALITIYLVSYLTKRSHKNKLTLGLKLLFSGIVIVGSSIGVILGIEMINNRKVKMFAAFDLYSLLIGTLSSVISFFYFLRKRHSQNISPIASL